MTMIREAFIDHINQPKQRRNNALERCLDPNNVKTSVLEKRAEWMVNSTVGPKVLEVGCGDGLLCYLLQNRTDIKEVYAIDAQEDILEVASSNMDSEKIKFRWGLAEELPFRNSFFDTVSMGMVLEHVNDVNISLKEAHRVLKINGRIIIVVPVDGATSICHLRTFTPLSVLSHMQSYFDISYFDIRKLSSRKEYMACIGLKKRNAS